MSPYNHSFQPSKWFKEQILQLVKQREEFFRREEEIAKKEAKMIQQYKTDRAEFEVKFRELNEIRVANGLRRLPFNVILSALYPDIKPIPRPPRFPSILDRFPMWSLMPLPTVLPLASGNPWEQGSPIKPKIESNEADSQNPAADAKKLKSSSPASSDAQTQSAKPFSSRKEVWSIVSKFISLKLAFTSSALSYLPGPTGLDYTPNNAPFKAHEHALTNLLTKLGAVPSYGDPEVRRVRKDTVRAIETELARIDKKKVKIQGRPQVEPATIMLPDDEDRKLHIEVDTPVVSLDGPVVSSGEIVAIPDEPGLSSDEPLVPSDQPPTSFQSITFDESFDSDEQAWDMPERVFSPFCESFASESTDDWSIIAAETE